MDTIPTPALDKFLEDHKRTCTFWIFSGDRHCSCGRDAARADLERLRAALTEPKQGILPAFQVLETV